MSKIYFKTSEEKKIGNSIDSKQVSNLTQGYNDAE